MKKKERFVQYGDTDVKHNVDPLEGDGPWLDNVHLPHELEKEDEDYKRYLVKYNRYGKNETRLSEEGYAGLVQEYRLLQDREIKDPTYSWKEYEKMDNIAKKCFFKF